MFENLGAWLQFGIGGGFLVLLFLGLRNGTIFTRSSVLLLTQLYEQRLADKDKYISKLEEINNKVDERNDLLVSRIPQLLEISRAHGMIEALPPQVSEQVVK